ncbi:MAG: hypothetical protein OXH08_02335 [Gammaproteobacteria bacterium]|nr:hypothetical protein [Gammaproteobacteria bacterium]MDE0650618.1 hypothetical protein [Gammaproteobacteria bacterium]MXW11180.1 hypothetical protein [Gammaproteobacteria bacterium]MYC52069.1 hypothetical protein [Gammaproteobacteria bacterium]
MEALTAMVLLVAVMAAALQTLTTLRHALGSVTGDAQVRETRRITRYTLAQELRTGLAGIDWVTGARDSVAVRAFRGTGVGCAASSQPLWAVRYTGLRRPDPAKDSVLVLAADGVWRVAKLVRARAGACGDGAGGEVWELHPAVPEAVVGRVFERGSYHVAAGAFRYRPGRGGRQPLTAQILQTGAGVASAVSGRGAGLDLRLAFGQAPVATTIDSARVWPREMWP